MSPGKGKNELNWSLSRDKFHANRIGQVIGTLHCWLTCQHAHSKNALTKEKFVFYFLKMRKLFYNPHLPYQAQLLLNSVDYPLCFTMDIFSAFTNDIIYMMAHKRTTYFIYKTLWNEMNFTKAKFNKDANNHQDKMSVQETRIKTSRVKCVSLVAENCLFLISFC